MRLPNSWNGSNEVCAPVGAGGAGGVCASAGESARSRSQGVSLDTIGDSVLKTVHNCDENASYRICDTMHYKQVRIDHRARPRDQAGIPSPTPPQCLAALSSGPAR